MKRIGPIRSAPEGISKSVLIHRPESRVKPFSFATPPLSPALMKQEKTMMTPQSDGSCPFTAARRMAVRLVVAATLTIGIIGSGAGCTLPAAKHPATTPTNGVPHEYIIGAGDVLEVLVWKNETLSRTVIVRPDGKISLPLVNDVQAAGLTPMALKEQISKELKKFKEIPEVSVIVTETRSQVVYLMGQVVRPGPYPLAPNATVVQVIAQAGGFTPFADHNNIVILRRGSEGAKEQRLEVSYKSILAGRSKKGDIALQAGDTIVVP